jgi:mitochondrial enoyl-[acyl-carrier protein] reductase / trans-2-enoyl-CoA reductase
MPKAVMAKALICRGAGQWFEQLALVEHELPPAPARGQLRVRLLAAAVHPSDFGLMAGSYGKAISYPAIVGREGVGEVVAVGAGVRGFGLGCRVRMPEALGAWQSELDIPAAGVVRLPKEIPAEQLALSFINPPTAWRLLEDFVKLRRGDTIITNAGRSAVSQALIQLGVERELNVVAVVRQADSPTCDWLRGLGAGDVVAEDSGYEASYAGRARLAINQVGGLSVQRLIKCLGVGGTCVTIGGASKDAVRYPTRELIFSDITLRGFWLDAWYRSHTPAQALQLWRQIWQRMRAGQLHQAVAGSFALADYAQALALAQGGQRQGKVLLTP